MILKGCWEIFSSVLFLSLAGGENVQSRNHFSLMSLESSISRQVDSE